MCEYISMFLFSSFSEPNHVGGLAHPVNEGDAQKYTSQRMSMETL